MSAAGGARAVESFTKGWWFVLLVLLTACSTPGPLDEDGNPEVSPAGRYEALAYYAWLQGASADELARELQRLDQEWPRASVVDKAQLALLLSASALTDAERELRARQILDDITGELVLTQRSRDYLALAGVWRSVLVLRDNLSMAAGELRASRARLGETGGELTVLREELAGTLEAKSASDRRVADLEVQLKALKKQIDALTTIEQQLIEREQSQRQ